MSAAQQPWLTGSDASSSTSESSCFLALSPALLSPSLETELWRKAAAEGTSSASLIETSYDVLHVIGLHIPCMWEGALNTPLQQVMLSAKKESARA